jgi:hypothetical protein
MITIAFRQVRPTIPTLQSPWLSGFPDQATTVTVADFRRMSGLAEQYAALILLHHLPGRTT